ncbi:MAG: sialate O-acetylesterase [Planctomycetaceae bacterium]|nr:sialate O-acetylesterase [Planctomycetaceae bacterium]
MLRKSLVALTCLLAVSSAALAAGELKLPAIISDHMVLQADKAAPIWGWAAADVKVTVSFADQKLTAAADKDGKWSVEFKGLKAGTAGKLVVSAGEKSITVNDVLVGEVWLGSGQSNMWWRVSQAANARAEAAVAKYPQIRMFTVKQAGSPAPAADCAGSWEVCTPQTVLGFSATAYYFGRDLHKALKQPVGLINSSVGGTPIESWLPAAPKADDAKADEPKATPAPRKATPKAAKARKRSAGGGDLYNGMMAPLAPYGLRGFLWYQGESNAGNGKLYVSQLATLIKSWRDAWSDETAFFLTVQLPNFQAPQKQPVESSGWAMVREAELKSLTLPNTGIAVTIDIGEAGNIHPKNKQDVGKRLALWALATVYDKKLTYCGPLYKSMAVEGDKIVLSFDHIGGGLAVQGGGKLKGFAVAGEDKKFVWADATITGDTVVLTGVKNPKAARYAWANNPDCNLVNKDALPASPFRTDDWEQ